MSFVITLGDVLTLMVVLLVGISTLWIMGPVWWREWRCKHREVQQNHIADAICQKCGKNLGWIGNPGRREWRQ